jgi:3-deoxy-D-manno-octulosonate 8-phosphate phosphatase (KDO 8-P phosphatase)
MAKLSNAALKKIKFVMLDVDGVLTDGSIIIGSDGTEYKNFSVKDGTGITLGRCAGLKFGIISGRYSKVIELRAKELKCDALYQDVMVKIEAYEDFKKKSGYKDEEICFVGDEIIDIPVMEKCGFSAAPRDSVKEAIKAADYICKMDGGKGAVREVIELILCAQGLGQKAINRYLRHEK